MRSSAAKSSSAGTATRPAFFAMCAENASSITRRPSAVSREPCDLRPAVSTGSAGRFPDDEPFALESIKALREAARRDHRRAREFRRLPCIRLARPSESAQHIEFALSQSMLSVHRDDPVRERRCEAVPPSDESLRTHAHVGAFA